jgi:hypothetical protein
MGHRDGILRWEHNIVGFCVSEEDRSVGWRWSPSGLLSSGGADFPLDLLHDRHAKLLATPQVVLPVDAVKNLAGMTPRPQKEPLPAATGGGVQLPDGQPKTAAPQLGDGVRDDWATTLQARGGWRPPPPAAVAGHVGSAHGQGGDGSAAARAAGTHPEVAHEMVAANGAVRPPGLAQPEGAPPPGGAGLQPAPGKCGAQRDTGSTGGCSARGRAPVAGTQDMTLALGPCVFLPGHPKSLVESTRKR